ncbi:hypothetical protein NPX13_g6673 [Xylaria arbuscula]|uniref:Elongation of fatty acids protein n=1 Tax=Xylaria arbuscula TaxID=114810 RepID=A0A9W8TLI6_9PEZI|nr:hypothetical protein NPX13_g6673 [Xylaria arbuscula]
MAAPIVYASYPPSHLFQLPPYSDPLPIPPPHFDYLFTIPDKWFTAALDPKVPITVATVYAVTAKALNAYNKSTGKKPWAISKTRAFNAFVILHNIFLAVYSAWTWYGMLRALQNTIVSPNGPDGWAGTVDSFCKMNGPAGLKNAQTYNQGTETWGSLSGLVGAPNREQGGRLWNNGLAFYGWLFYISKFYEVLDTLIILAKGKFSSTLQTYHHAGAMMAMWAGMRYMAAPIWIFVFFNSAIHSLMYTYYTVTAFNVRVPNGIKRSLTSLQISQFIIGGSAAMVHSFVSYLVPVEGSGSTTKYQKVDCIHTTGQTFSIWLNVSYLAPLTYLFGSFFVASYLRRSKAEVVRGKTDRRRSNVVLAEKASWDAARGLEREMYGESNEGVIVEDSDESSSSSEASGVKVNGKSKN